MRAALSVSFVFCILIVFVFTGCFNGPREQTLDHYKVYTASDRLDHYKVYEVGEDDDNGGGDYGLDHYKVYEVAGDDGNGGGDYELDHYKVYSVSEPPQSEEVRVTLVDQFIRDRYDVISGAMTGNIEYFGIPASKTREGSDRTEGIKDAFTHLTWYELNMEEEITVEIKFHNQFDVDGGEQTWTIRGPIYLLVPTDKNNPDDNPRREENKHFLCYEVIKSEGWSRPETRFIVGDQIDEIDPVEVMRPRFFCAPVEKTVEGGEEPKPVDLDGEHLACYDITGKEAGIPVGIQNQFGQVDELLLEESLMLCVPSDKIEP